MSTCKEISVNLPLRAVVHPEWVAGRSAAGTQIGDRYCTIILPQYSHVFRSALGNLMRGIVVSEAVPTIDDAGQSVVASIFGFVEKDPVAYMDGKTTAFIPCMGRRFISMVENPSRAIDSYHRRLITNTNLGLAALGADVRLTPLDNHF